MSDVDLNDPAAVDREIASLRDMRRLIERKIKDLQPYTTEAVQSRERHAQWQAEMAAKDPGYRDMFRADAIRKANPVSFNCGTTARDAEASAARFRARAEVFDAERLWFYAGQDQDKAEQYDALAEHRRELNRERVARHRARRRGQEA
jgi:hypothetical protein